MKCPTCGMESRTEIEEREQLFDKSVDRKTRFALTYVVIFGVLSRDQMPNQLASVFLISVIFYFILLSKVSYSAASTLSCKRSLKALNMCAVITSFVFSYEAVSYIIGLPDPGYSVDFLYFWLGIFGLGFIMSKLLVFSERRLKDLGKLFKFYYS